MRGEPRVASVWRSDASPSLRRGPATIRSSLPERLRSPSQFGAVAAGAQIRLARRWLALQARLEPGAPSEAASASAATPRVPVTAATDRSPPRSVSSMRIGLTIAKRNARRAVDRARIKRVLREALRAAAPGVQAAAAPHGIDVVLRLRAPWPAVDPVGHAERARALRAEADQLLVDLVGRLATAHAAPGARPT